MTMDKIIEALGVTAELMGQQVTPAALVMMAEDLAGYPQQQVLEALRRVRRECRRMTLADIIERMEAADGRPNADEAWANAMVALDESQTVVWTREALEAWGIARPLMVINDKTGARMAFRGAYERLVEESRARKEPAHWSASLGWDVDNRREVLESAVQAGRLTHTQAQGLLPAPAQDPDVAQAIVRLVTFNGDVVDSEAHDREVHRRRIEELRQTLARKAAT